ncbi:MAG: hypothetical protein ACRDD7_06210 [Peptostreptococcaceae bacterium]
MARDLRSLKRRDLKCIIIEDFETGRVFKINKPNDIKEALLKYSENEITKIYNPTKEQKAKIFKIMEISEKEGKVVTQIKGEDVLIALIPMLTDIKIDLTLNEDLELIEEIIEDPNEVFEIVSRELNDILLSININYIENLKLISQLPSEILDNLGDVK